MLSAGVHSSNPTSFFVGLSANSRDHERAREDSGVWGVRTRITHNRSKEPWHPRTRHPERGKRRGQQHLRRRLWGDFASNAGGTDVGGHDTFVFGPHNGNDFIYDFHQGGEDFIEIDAKKPETFADLNIQVVGGNRHLTASSILTPTTA